MEWSQKNNMKLHEHKFELMVHGASLNLLLHELPFTNVLWSYHVSEDRVLRPSNELRDLGVNVRGDLSWSSHIELITTRAQLMAAWVLSVFKSREESVMVPLYKSLIRSHLEYCCPIWSPNKIADVRKLENVQRRFTAEISGIQHLNYWYRLKSLQLMSLQRRRERYILIQMWKQLHKQSAGEITIRFRSESRLGIQAIVPSVNHSSRLANRSLYENSFAVNGARMWNALPSSITTIDSESSFRLKIAN